MGREIFQCHCTTDGLSHSSAQPGAPAQVGPQKGGRTHSRTGAATVAASPAGMSGFSPRSAAGVVASRRARACRAEGPETSE